MPMWPTDSNKWRLFDQEERKETMFGIKRYGYLVAGLGLRRDKILADGDEWRIKGLYGEASSGSKDNGLWDLGDVELRELESTKADASDDYKSVADSEHTSTGVETNTVSSTVET